ISQQWSPILNSMAQICHATSKRTGNPCGSYAMPGQQVCWMHGGAQKAAIAKGIRRDLVEVGRNLATGYGVPIPVTPEEALLQELERTQGHVTWLEEQMLETAPQELVQGWYLWKQSSESTTGVSSKQ